MAADPNTFPRQKYLLGVIRGCCCKCHLCTKFTFPLMHRTTHSVWWCYCVLLLQPIMSRSIPCNDSTISEELELGILFSLASMCYPWCVILRRFPLPYVQKCPRSLLVISQPLFCGVIALMPLMTGLSFFCTLPTLKSSTFLDKLYGDNLEGTLVNIGVLLKQMAKAHSASSTSVLIFWLWLLYSKKSPVIFSPRLQSLSVSLPVPRATDTRELEGQNEGSQLGGSWSQCYA